MKNSIEFYKGAISVIKLDQPVGAMLQEMLADMKEALQENDEHRSHALGLDIADETARRDYEYWNHIKDVNQSVIHMNTNSRSWIIARPSLQKRLGLRACISDRQPWLEADPDFVEPAAED